MRTLTGLAVVVAIVISLGCRIEDDFGSVPRHRRARHPRIIANLDGGAAGISEDGCPCACLWKLVEFGAAAPAVLRGCHDASGATEPDPLSPLGPWR